MKHIFLFLALGLSLLFLSCEKEDMTGEDRDYTLPGDVDVSYMDNEKEPLVYIEVQGKAYEMFKVNNNSKVSYHRTNGDPRYHLKWEHDLDSVSYIYHYRHDPSPNGDWYRVDIYTFYGNYLDIKDIKKIFDYHKIFED